MASCFSVLSVALVAAAALVSAVSAKDEFGLSAVAYNKESMTEALEKSNNFIMFYAPWCGHCKRLHPTWEELAAKYNDKPEAERDVVIGKVDCTIETALCSDHDVTGYPTLKFIPKGKTTGEKFRGQRDLSSLVKFVSKSMGLEVEEEEAAPAGSDAVVVENGLHILSEKSFAEHVKSGDHFIKFYAPWCGHCQKLAPTWDELAKDFEKDSHVKIAKLDCTTAQSVCQEHEVKGYPTLFYFRNGKKVETYKGARSLGELKDFVKSMKDVKDDQEKDKVPTEEPASPVLALDKDNFNDQIKEGVTFVKFFAPWCGHCKRLAPTWDELAKKFADNKIVKIAKVDCTSDENKNKQLCNDQTVNGFPTLHIYKDGKKVEEYNGKRDMDELVSFVNKHASSKKDEL